MKAITTRTDGALEWKEVPDPVLGPEEVRVDIHATAVNRADLLQRIGKYPPPPGAPEWMGLEMSGIIREIGSGVGESGWKIGDPVCALLAGGGYAESVCVRSELLLPVPSGLTLTEAASLPETFATAYLNLYLEAGLVPGETVLVHAGASGVGISAVQIARALGSRVVATAGSAEKRQRVVDLGAEEVVGYGTEEVRDLLVRREADGHPVNVVLDCRGGTDLGPHLSLLAPDGRWVVIATLEGPRTAVDLRSLLVKRLRVIGSTLRVRPLETKIRILRGLEERVWPRIAEGAIRPVIHAELPIGLAEEAHTILERRENVGKVVLRVR